MPRRTAAPGDSMTRLASAGTPPPKRATTSSEEPRSSSIFPGSTSTLAASAREAIAKPAPAWERGAEQGDRHGDQETERHHVGNLAAAQRPR